MNKDTIHDSIDHHHDYAPMTEPRCRPGRLWQVSGPTASAPMRGTHESWLVPVQLGPGKSCECFVKSRWSGQLRVMIFCGMVSRCFPTFGHFLCDARHVSSLSTSGVPLGWVSASLLAFVDSHSACSWQLNDTWIVQEFWDFNHQSIFMTKAPSSHGQKDTDVSRKVTQKNQTYRTCTIAWKCMKPMIQVVLVCFSLFALQGPNETCQTIQSPPGGRPGLF